MILATFLLLVTLSGLSFYIGYVTGQEAGGSEGYQLGYYDGLHRDEPGITFRARRF